MNDFNFYFFKGRVALYAILKAMGVQAEDEVILPGFTCIVVPNAIIYLGAKPVYVDIDQETFNIDPSKLEEEITKKTRAIIIQHTFGIPADMDKILKIARKYNLYVIEDSCHAIGTRYKKKEIGTFGDASFFSSQWSKPITTGLGGWAVVNHPELKERMERIYPQFMEPSSREVFVLNLEYLLYSKLMTPPLFWLAQTTFRKLSSLGVAVGSSTNEELQCKMPFDYEKKMSLWQKKVLKKELNHLEQVISHRKWIVSQYERLLPQAGIQPISLNEDYEPAFLRYPVYVKDKKRILELARRNKIEMGDWFVSPVHPNLDGWEKVFYKKGTCPKAEEICGLVVNLPTHPKIKEKHVTKLIDFMKNYT